MAAKKKKSRRSPIRWLARTAFRLFMTVIAVTVLLVLAVAVLNPPRTPYIWLEQRRLGEVQFDWVDMADIAPVMARSAVAAEDANFCLHWGFDMAAIRQAIADGAIRGASTITQQTIKNVYLWHGRDWARKAVEALITPGVEAIWPKRRILEVYLNVAEFDEGVFGVGPAAQHYFGVTASDLTAQQAALLAAVLPDPKNRSAANPSSAVRARANAILDGAATIEADERSACFHS